ncbi:MAG: DarT ssDNA thymidine ADP-ribosyltransferase family protein [Bacilli bacterium]|nr:DarT ssDNA thymidine ADP-ribosyltransferase family protein [Bacilli bacterium]
MGIENVKQGKLIYHLTKLSNLDSILELGLLPRENMLKKNISFDDVANKEIITKRSMLGLNKYTPFHFHPFSSFDVAVKNTYNNENFIYICLLRKVARNNGFKILPRHPLNMDECILMDYDEGFQAIDWDIMQEKGLDDDNAKQIKMAECLTDLIVPVNCFQCIYVKNEEIKEIVEKKLKEHGVERKPPFVDIMPWV